MPTTASARTEPILPDPHPLSSVQQVFNVVDRNFLAGYRDNFNPLGRCSGCSQLRPAAALQETMRGMLCLTCHESYARECALWLIRNRCNAAKRKAVR